VHEGVELNKIKLLPLFSAVDYFYFFLLLLFFETPVTYIQVIFSFFAFLVT